MWDEVANGWSRYLENVFVLPLGLLLRWECQGSLEEFEKGGFAGVLASENENANGIVSLLVV